MIGLHQLRTSKYFVPVPARRVTDPFFRWVYAQFIAVDANFKLRLKNRQISDPELGPGWSYFVENSAYARHVAKNSHEKEVGCIRNAGGSLSYQF